MEKGQCAAQDTLPTMYGIMIAFLTCLVGYALWVSVIIRVMIRSAIDDHLPFLLSRVCSLWVVRPESRVFVQVTQPPCE